MKLEGAHYHMMDEDYDYSDDPWGSLEDEGGCFKSYTVTYTDDTTGEDYEREVCYQYYPDWHYEMEEGENGVDYVDYGHEQIPVYPLEDAVCCMPGMDCWNSAYEGAAGKDAMIEELERLVWDYPEVKAHFDYLN